jgi:hypothetical protein
METRFEIVETEDYILLVSDEETKFRDGNIVLWNNKVLINSKNASMRGGNFTECKKIIAYQPKHNEASKLNLPQLRLLLQGFH